MISLRRWSSGAEVESENARKRERNARERKIYEAKQRKYRRREFATPYEKEWNTLKTPLTGYWKAKTPLYEEMELLTDDLNELTILMEKHQSEADAIHDNPQVMRARALHSHTALAHCTRPN